jgi:hypothetical protein|tara:strand:+ start:124 stop:384 length:261 start_codon:yes stop_codon:yes gene_type:complete
MKKFEVNKITPLHDLSWYIKWVSAFVILLGMSLTSMEVYPYNLYVHLVGVSGWFVVGMLWHDRALIFLNAVAIAVFLMGIINYYII